MALLAPENSRGLPAGRESLQDSPTLDELRTETVGLVMAVAPLVDTDGRLPAQLGAELVQRYRDYGRSLSQAVEAAIRLSGINDSEQINHLMVDILANEAERRRDAYQAMLNGVGVDEKDINRALATPRAPAWDNDQKLEELSASWQEALEGYGVPDMELVPGVRIDYIRYKVITDLSREAGFLRAAVTHIDNETV